MRYSISAICPATKQELSIFFTPDEAQADREVDKILDAGDLVVVRLLKD